MPIKHSKQNWTIGQNVKVGFLSLKVIAFTPTPGDYRPDTYTLENSKGIQYTFTPHHGLERLDPSEYVSIPAIQNSLPVVYSRMFIN